MNTNCQMIVFSNKAYNAIIRESFEKDPVETGGILLGHILDNGLWLVMEVLPPGSRSTFEVAYFEYDEIFVNYLAQSVANQYKVPLELIGLWHRHPGSFDSFSSTDDQTNTTFASLNVNGAISGLVNIDPKFRLTMYHVSHADTRNSQELRRPHYNKVDIEIGDDIIPEEYFELKYYSNSDSNPNPSIDRANGRVSRADTSNAGEKGNLDIRRITSENMGHETVISDNEHQDATTNELLKEILVLGYQFIKKKHKLFLIIFLLVLSGFSLNVAWENFEEFPKWVSSIFSPNKNNGDEYVLSSKGKDLLVGEKFKLHITPTPQKDVKWKSDDPQIASVQNGNVIAHKKGDTEIYAEFDDIKLKCNISVNKVEYYLKEDDVEMKVGDTFLLEIDPLAQNVSWISNDENIAVVNNEGRITAKEEGKTNIIAQFGDNKLTCSIEVEADESDKGGQTVSIKIQTWNNSGKGKENLSKKNVPFGLTKETKQLITSKNIDKKLITWTSSDENIATVNDNGYVTMLKDGEVTINVLYNDVQMDSVLLTIEK